MKPAVCIIRFASYPKESHVRRDAQCLHDAGYAVDIIASRDEGQKGRETVDGVRVHRLPISTRRGSAAVYMWRYSVFFILCFLTLSVLHLRRRYRVVEVDTMPDFLVFATLLPKLTGAKIILYLFEAMPELFDAKLRRTSGHVVSRSLRTIERWATRYADHVVTVNRIHEAIVAARCPVAGKVSVILNVPREELIRRATPPRDASGAFVLVYHGTIAERYGVQTAVEALAKIGDERQHMRLLVLGEGDYLDDLKRMTSDLGVADRVEFMGWVSFERMVEILSCADVGLVPLIRDGYTDLMLPNKLFEYIGLDIPVVSARTDAIHEYYGEGCLAYYEPGDATDCARAIVDLYDDPSKRRGIAEEAKKVYESSHRWGLMQEVYTGIYRRLLDR
jgi:glycosyltransferase involved in cell wall biosynthesis